MRKRITKAQVIEALLVCCEMHTSNGAQGRLPEWARSPSGEPNFSLIAFEARQRLGLKKYPGLSVEQTRAMRARRSAA